MKTETYVINNRLAGNVGQCVMAMTMKRFTYNTQAALAKKKKKKNRRTDWLEVEATRKSNGAGEVERVGIRIMETGEYRDNIKNH